MAARSVTEARRADQLALSRDLNPLHTLIPDRDHLPAPRSQTLKGCPFDPRSYRNSFAVAMKPSGVVRRSPAGPLRHGALSGLRMAYFRPPARLVILALPSWGGNWQPAPAGWRTAPAAIIARNGSQSEYTGILHGSVSFDAWTGVHWSQAGTRFCSVKAGRRVIQLGAGASPPQIISAKGAGGRERDTARENTQTEHCKGREPARTYSQRQMAPIIAAAETANTANNGERA